MKKATHSAAGQSINQIIRPILLALKCEFSMNKKALGATIFSVNDAEARLLSFRNSLPRSLAKKQFYFVKVDVQACFDSIPPAAAYRVAKRFLKLSEYRTRRYSKVLLQNGVPVRQFHQIAYPGSIDDMPSGVQDDEYLKELLSAVTALNGYDDEEGGPRSGFAALMQKKERSMNKAVFVDGVRFDKHDKITLLNLLIEHIAGHIVKVANFGNLYAILANLINRLVVSFISRKEEFRKGLRYLHFYAIFYMPVWNETCYRLRVKMMDYLCV